MATKLWRHVQRGEPDVCWPWTGVRMAGYGRVKTGARPVHVFAHRVAWQLTNGDIPEGMSVLHRCDNPPCCNPAHLYLGTHQDNVRDMMERGRHRPGRQGRAKLAPDDVRSIRAALKAGASKRSLARQHGVARRTVSAIETGRTWAGIA